MNEAPTNQVPRIMVTNHKGGVGKTTMTTTLASGLAMLGAKVGIIDTDSQGHIALALRLTRFDALYKVHAGELLLTDAVKVVDKSVYIPEVIPPEWNLKNPHDGEIYVLPGYKQTAAITRIEGYSPFDIYQICTDMAETFELDMIFIDTSPSYRELDSGINFAATSVLYISEPALPSVDGVNQSIKELKVLNTKNNPHRTWQTRFIGCLINKNESRKKSHRGQTGTLTNALGNKVWSPVRKSDLWEASFNAGSSIFAYSPESESVINDAWRAVRRFLREEFGEVNNATV